MRPLRESRAAPPPRDPPFPEDPWRTPPPLAWIGGRVAKERTRCSPDARRGKGGRRMASKLARLVKLRDGQRPLRGEGSGTEQLGRTALCRDMPSRPRVKRQTPRRSSTGRLATELWPFTAPR